MKGFSVLDSQNHKNKTDTWLTPIWIVNALGEFDLDPCAYPGQETAYDKYYKNGDMKGYYKKDHSFKISQLYNWQPKTYFGRVNVLSVFDKVDSDKLQERK